LIGSPLKPVKPLKTNEWPEAAVLQPQSKPNDPFVSNQLNVFTNSTNQPVQNNSSYSKPPASVLPTFQVSQTDGKVPSYQSQMRSVPEVDKNGFPVNTQRVSAVFSTNDIYETKDPFASMPPIPRQIQPDNVTNRQTIGSFPSTISSLPFPSNNNNAGSNIPAVSRSTIQLSSSPYSANPQNTAREISAMPSPSSDRVPDDSVKVVSNWPPMEPTNTGLKSSPLMNQGFAPVSTTNDPFFPSNINTSNSSLNSSTNSSFASSTPGISQSPFPPVTSTTSFPVNTNAQNFSRTTVAPISGPNTASIRPAKPATQTDQTVNRGNISTNPFEDDSTSLQFAVPNQTNNRGSVSTNPFETPNSSTKSLNNTNQLNPPPSNIPPQQQPSSSTTDFFSATIPQSTKKSKDFDPFGPSGVKSSIPPVVPTSVVTPAVVSVSELSKPNTNTPPTSARLAPPPAKPAPQKEVSKPVPVETREPEPALVPDDSIPKIQIESSTIKPILNIGKTSAAPTSRPNSSRPNSSRVQKNNQNSRTSVGSTPFWRRNYYADLYLDGCIKDDQTNVSSAPAGSTALDLMRLTARSVRDSLFHIISFSRVKEDDRGVITKLVETFDKSLHIFEKIPSKSNDQERVLPFIESFMVEVRGIPVGGSLIIPLSWTVDNENEYCALVCLFRNTEETFNVAIVNTNKGPQGGLEYHPINIDLNDASFLKNVSMELKDVPKSKVYNTPFW
jgi:hypothetical protein